MRRNLTIALIVIIVLGLIGYTAHSLDLVGMLIRMHTPPPH
jgi:hypothetical protein